MRPKGTGSCRRRTWRQHDVVLRARDERVAAFLKPEKSRKREPSVIFLEIGLVRFAPFLNFGAVSAASHFRTCQRKRRKPTANVREITDAHESYERVKFADQSSTGPMLE